MTGANSYRGPETGLDHDDVIAPSELTEAVEVGDRLLATAERVADPPTWMVEVTAVDDDSVTVRELSVELRRERDKEVLANWFENRLGERPTEPDIDRAEVTDSVTLDPHVSTTQRTVVFMRQPESQMTAPMVDATSRRGGGASPVIGVTIERV